MGLLAAAYGYSRPQVEAPVETASARVETPEWVEMAARKAAQNDSPYLKEDQNPTILGFLPGLVKNAAGDVREFSTGIASLLGLGAGDLYNLGADVVEEINPLDKKDQDRSYFADDFLKQVAFDPEKAKREGLLKGIAPGLVETYKEQYGGLDKIAHTLYNDPLFVAADAFGLASMGGTAAAKGAVSTLAKPQIAAELGRVGALEKAALLLKFGDDAEAATLAAKEAAHAIENLSPEAARVKSTLPGAGWGKLGEGLEKGDALKLASHMGRTPDESFGLGGLRIDIPRTGSSNPIFTERKINPVRRKTEDVIRRIPGITESVAKLKKMGGEYLTEELRALVPDDDGVLESVRKPARTRAPVLGPAVEQLQRTVKAADQFGVDRVFTRSIDKLKTQQAFDKLSGMMVTRYYGTRDNHMAKLVDRIEAGAQEYAQKKGLTGAAAKKVQEQFLNVVHVRGAVDTPASYGRFSSIEFEADYLARNGPMTPAVQAALQSADVGFDVKHRYITVVDAADEQNVARKIAAQTGARHVAAKLDDMTGQYHHAYMEMPDGSRIALIPGEGAEAMQAMDDLMPLMQKHQEAARQATEELNELFRRGVLPEDPKAARIAAALRQAEKEVKAFRRRIEDLSDLAVISMKTQLGYDIDPWSRMLAGLRVDNHNLSLQPLLNKGKLKSMHELQERAFMATKLELFAAGKGSLKDAMKAAEKGDLSKLAAMGYSSKEEAFADLVGNTGEAGRRMDKRWMLDKARLGEAGEASMWDELDQLYQGAGRMTPVYFPWMSPEFQNVTDFLFHRSAVGMRSMASSARTKHAMGWLYLDDTFEKNPLDVYARTAAQVQKYLDMEDMIREIIDNWARPISKQSDVAPGEKLFAPDIVSKMIKMRAETELGAISHYVDGMEIGDSFVKSFKDMIDSGKVDNFDLEGLVDDIAEHFGGREKAVEAVDKLQLVEKLKSQGAPPAQIEAAISEANDIAGVILNSSGKAPRIYAIPEVVAKRLDQMGQFTFGWKARVFWDSPMQVWKTAVLAFSPRWIFYNLLGNVTFLKMQGGKLSDVARIMFSKLKGGAFSEQFDPAFLSRYEQLMGNLLHANPDLAHNLRGGFFHDVEQSVRHMGYAEQTAPGAAASSIRLYSSTANRFSNGAARMRKVNELVEEAFREAGFMRAMDRQLVQKNAAKSIDLFWRSKESLDEIAKLGFDKGAAARSLDEVNYFFNDYTRMGPIERNVIRRFIMPFYSFYKHITKLLVTYPFEHPLRATVMRSMTELSRDMAAQFGAMPDWLIGSVPIGEGQNEDETRFLNTRGLNPFSAMSAGLFETAGSGLAPQIKIPLERITGRSMLTGKPFSSPNAVTPFGSNQQYQIDPETGEVDPSTVLPSLPYHIAQQFPQFKLGQDLVSFLSGEGTGARYGTGEMMIDPATGKPVFPGSFGLDVASMGGLSTTDYALGEYQTRRAEEERSALIEWLRRQGLLEQPASAF